MNLYVEYKKVGVIEPERRTVVTRGREVEKWGNVDQRVQNFSDKMSKFWEADVQHGDCS